VLKLARDVRLPTAAMLAQRWSPTLSTEAPRKKG
jgi:hypothetical protein